MKVLVIAQRVPYPPNKGEKLRTYNQIKYLTELGNEIFVAAPYENEEEILHFKELEINLKIKTTTKKLQSKTLRYIKGLVKGEAFSVANFKSAELELAIQQLVREHDFDAILYSASSMAHYAKNFTSKKLMDFMDVDSDKWEQYEHNASWPMSIIYRREKKLIAQLERNIQQTFDHCFLISDKEVRLFAQNNNTDNVHVLANGIDFEGFYPNPKGLRENITNDPVFLFVGVMDYKPNIEAVVWFSRYVWKKIIKNYPKATFNIVGMHPSAEVLALKAQQGIKVSGFVDDVLPYFQNADIFIAPFLMARGVQNKVLQAFSCGLPTICTLLGSEGIDCEHNKNYLCANTEQEFVSGIETLIKDFEKRRTLGIEANRLIMQNYAWNEKLTVLNNIISNTIP